MQALGQKALKPAQQAVILHAFGLQAMSDACLQTNICDSEWQNKLQGLDPNPRMAIHLYVLYIYIDVYK